MAATIPNPRALAELFEQIIRAVYRDAYSSGLNPAQWWALRYLARTSAGLRTPAALASSYLAGRSTISQTVASLVGKGLVEKTRDHQDGRSRRLTLTPAGRRMLKHDPIERLTRAIEGLSAERQIQAAEIAEALVPGVFQKHQGGLWTIAKRRSGNGRLRPSRSLPPR